MTVELDYFKPEVSIVNPFILLREVALQLQQQAGQRVGIAFHLLEDVVIKIQNLIEIGEQRLSFKDIGVCIQPDIVALVFIILIVNLPNNPLKEVV